MEKSSDHTKQTGAYYTNRDIASFLVAWAIRTPRDALLDPSFGRGVFLEEAVSELHPIGSTDQILGVEIDKDAHNLVITKMKGTVRSENLILANFFDVVSRNSEKKTGIELPKVEAVVGNPPFIRYQKFKGISRRTAKRRTEEMGIELNGHSSSWAYFVVHSLSFLKEGGRLGMVIPGEAMHADYARSVLSLLYKSFREVAFLSFRKRLFPKVSEDTLLLLAEDYGHQPCQMRIVDLENMGSLQESLPKGEKADTKEIINGDTRLIEYLLPLDVRKLYKKLKLDNAVELLGNLARIGIGYVTGDNDFFHLTQQQAEQFRIHDKHLKKCVRSGSQLNGLLFTEDDWKELSELGEPVLLLSPSGRIENLPRSIKAYLGAGENLGVPKGFKCNNRSPWWTVRNIHECDGFLTYMSDERAKLVVNSAGVAAPNTLHIVRMNELVRGHITKIAVCWLTSLTTLSTEIEGRSLGGGLLKIEPKEVSRILIPFPEIKTNVLNRSSKKLDRLLRKNQFDEAHDLANEIVLCDGLKMNESDVNMLREGAEVLRKRRRNR